MFPVKLQLVSLKKHPFSPREDVLDILGLLLKMPFLNKNVLDEVLITVVRDWCVLAHRPPGPSPKLFNVLLVWKAQSPGPPGSHELCLLINTQHVAKASRHVSGFVVPG